MKYFFGEGYVSGSQTTGPGKTDKTVNATRSLIRKPGRVYNQINNCDVQAKRNYIRVVLWTKSQTGSGIKATLLIKNPNIRFRELVIKPVEDDGLVPKDWINSAVRYLHCCISQLASDQALGDKCVPARRLRCSPN